MALTGDLRHLFCDSQTSLNRATVCFTIEMFSNKFIDNQ